MRTIHKFVVPITDDPTPIPMPKGATIVHVGHQDVGMPRELAVMFWAEVDTDADAETRTFRVYGACSPIPDDCTYVGTDLATDYLVWHLFEVVR